MLPSTLWFWLTIGPSINESSLEPGMDVFRQQADGAWKIIRYLACEAP